MYIERLLIYRPFFRDLLQKLPLRNDALFDEELSQRIGLREAGN